MYLLILTYKNALLLHEQIRYYDLSLVTLIEALDSDTIFGKYHFVITLSKQRGKLIY